MTVDVAERMPARRALATERLHKFVVTDLQIATDDLLVSAHADGTITIQSAAGIGAEPSQTSRRSAFREATVVFSAPTMVR